MSRRAIATMAGILAWAGSGMAAKTVEYQAAGTLGKADGLGEISFMAMGQNDHLLVASGGDVREYDPEGGKCVRTIATGLPEVNCMAMAGDTLYVLSTRTEAKELTYQGRKYTRQMPTGVVCRKFGPDGKAAGELALKEVKSGNSIRIIGDKLYVADLTAHAISVFNLKSGKQTGKIGSNIRLCCGIFDFNVDPKNGDVLVANLGAFQVQRYSPSGGLKSAFGQRGADENSFHGCCNPVSVSMLPDGNLVAVEKDPSRVKIHSASGQYLGAFKNLESLVQGCNHVSLATDSKGRVYLGVNASSRHYIVRYIPGAK